MPPTVEDAVVLPPMEEQAPKEDAAPSTASETAAPEPAAPLKEPAVAPVVAPAVAPAVPEQPTPPPAPAPPAPAKAPTIGIIYPPPELRNIVDKTAAFVARNGPEFEARIRQNEINNSKFNFLNSGDPYNAYYQHKVKEAKEGKIQPELALAPTPTKPGQQQQQSGAPASKQDLISKIVEQPIVPKEPPPEFEFVADPPSISALDLDIVKLTAQFVARNGRQFLTNLMNREQRNYQFDFLRPQHSLFTYFMKLLEQYTKILVPGKDLMPRLKRESEEPKSILDQVRYRVEWTKLQEAQKRREEEEAERERVQYAQIDWHDFVVVETVDYQPNEQGLFPPPTTPDEVGSRVLAQQRMEEEGEEVEMEVESDEEGGGASDKEDEDDTPPPPTTTTSTTTSTTTTPSLPARAPSPPPQPPKEAPPQLPPLPPNPEQVVVRKDYNPKGGKPAKPSSEQYLISPITGEKIPADKMQEHMRIGLLDPRWVEQRDRAIQEKMQQDEVFAPGSAIESSLKQFAERRTDIFGFGDEETAIGKKIGEEDRRPQEKVTWDGHTASMEAATRAARANITIEEQIQQIHKIKGLLPDEEKERIGPAKPQHGSQQQMLPPLPPLPPPPVSAAPPVSAPKPPPPKPPPPPQAPPPKSTAPPTLIPPAALRTQMAPVIAHPPMPTPPRPMMAAPQGLMMAHLRPPPGMLGMPQGVHPPMAFAPMPPAMAPLPPEMPPSLPADDEPPSKKTKTEESLIPEAEFLAKNKGPVTVRVQVPGAQEKPEWKLNGQILTMTLPLTDTVSVLKAKLHEELGMPPGKQKLQYEGMFVKDSNTLAFYNLGPNSTIVLQVKERGGRKK